jgi:hypothetical protein
MPRPSGRTVRMSVLFLLLVAALFWVWHTNANPQRVTLFVTALVAAVTGVYALLTYEILLQNQVTARAALESSALMEKSLRFSHTANLIFETISTKDPTLGGSVAAIDNDDYQRAREEHAGGGEQQKEYVFAVVTNKGQGTATNVVIEVEYQVTDNSNAIRQTVVPRRATLQTLEPGAGAALCIFIWRVPTPGDAVGLRSVHITASDFYRDAIGEAPQQITVDVAAHQVSRVANGVVRLA